MARGGAGRGEGEGDQGQGGKTPVNSRHGGQGSGLSCCQLPVNEGGWGRDPETKEREEIPGRTPIG